MNVSSGYTARVGNRTYQVPERNAGQAAAYDENGDKRITLSEIKANIGGLPNGLTLNKNDFAVEIRQGMLEQPSPHVDHYPTADEIDARLKSLADAHPENARLVSIGTSESGREIQALHISENVNSPETSAKPSVIVTGNLHAREWTTNGAVSTAAERLLNGAAPEALENLELWFVPNANPDGYEHS